MLDIREYLPRAGMLLAITNQMETSLPDEQNVHIKAYKERSNSPNKAEDSGIALPNSLFHFLG